MARFESGWIKMHRKLIGTEWTNALDAIGKGILLELVMLANWKDSDKPLFRHRNMCLKMGQIATSEKELTARLRVSRKVLRDRLNRLVELGSIELQKNNHGSIITICNYIKYQCIENDEEQPRDIQGYNQGYNQGTSKGTYNEEIKNIKKKRSKELSIPSVVPTGVFNVLAQKWLEFAQQEMPWKKEDQKWTILNFELELERIARIMDLNLLGLESILEFIRKDEFWRKNAVSPFGLLKKSSKNDLRKIENILTRLRTKQHRVDDTLRRWAETEHKSPFEAS